MNPNLLIGDKYFNDNPTHVLGVQTIQKGRFGSDVIVVKGTIDDLAKIDAPDIENIDLYPEQELAVEIPAEIIEKVFESEGKKALKKQWKEKTKGKPVIPDYKASQEVYSYKEIDELYNKTVSRDEKEAYYMTRPWLDHKLLFETYQNTKEQLIEKRLLCWLPGNKYDYVHTYISGHISNKIRDLRANKEELIAIHGEQQFDFQIAILEKAKPEQKTFSGLSRIQLAPHSAFAKEHTISALRLDEPELGGETSLFKAFKKWLISLPADEFVSSTYKEIIDYFLDNKSIPVTSENPEKRKEEEALAINTRQRTQQEGQKMFDRFLEQELLPEDQARIAYLWNEKYNAIVDFDSNKIPIVFRISKTFKAGVPLMLNPTQRRGVAFANEQRSVLLAYGVGVGKTLGSIACMSAAHENGYTDYPLFVVPTNTYDKWIAEIQGRYDEKNGIFLQGALPHLPAVVGLFNLNPTIIYDLKIYSEEEQHLLDSIMQAIDFLKNTTAPIDEYRSIFKKVRNEFTDISTEGILSAYAQYEESTKAKKIKTIYQYAADQLANRYEYEIYSLGKIKPFPKGTIFVTTEVGLQRLAIPEDAQRSIKSDLFYILSQGEKASDNERAVAVLRERITQTMSSSQKNAKIDISEFGIDWVCFDEVHYYKKIFVNVKGQVTGEHKNRQGDTEATRERTKYELKSGQYPSARALSAYMLSHYLRWGHDGRNVIGLSATPFTNSPLEIFSMLSLINHPMLAKLGIDNMVEFFDTFMKIDYAIKYTPQKTVVKDIVLNGYNNLPQLRQVITQVIDKKDEGANLNRPTKIIYPSVARGKETSIPMTAEQTMLMKDIKAYINGKLDYDIICQSAIDEEVDNLDLDGASDEELLDNWEQTTGREYIGDRDNLPASARESMIRQIKSAKVPGFEIGEKLMSKDDSLGIRVLKSISLSKLLTVSPFLFYDACARSRGEEIDLPDYVDFVETSPKLRYIFALIKSVRDFEIANNLRLSGQVIYLNAAVKYFPLLLQYAVEKLGFKQSQVGMVTGKMSATAKEKVKNGFLAGDILLLIGSSTITVGVDLQNNASTLYNCYYDWNPTDAEQIEGRIWRQGNRFAFVRIVYPQLLNSADPVLFEYLNQKLLRNKEIWNVSSKEQTVELGENFKDFQKKLITDPEEKADWEILEQSEKVDSEIRFFENRRQKLADAIRSFNEYKKLLPVVREELTKIGAERTAKAKKTALEKQREARAELAEKYAEDAEKLAAALEKFNESKYDIETDPDGKYVPVDYNEWSPDELYKAAPRWIEFLEKVSWRDEKEMPYTYDNYWDVKRAVENFRYNYRDTMSAQERVLKPLGLTFENKDNPLASYDEALDKLKAQLASIHDTRAERVRHYEEEQRLNAGSIKTVEDRVMEFAAEHEKYLIPQLILNKLPDLPLATTEELLMPPVEETLLVEPLPEPVEDVPVVEPVAETVEIPVMPEPEPVEVTELETTEDAKERINKEINALNLAIKYVGAKEKKRIKAEIDALTIALKYS